MPLKDTLTLPTLTDAIAVRPESIRTPPDKTEVRGLRSTHSKTHLHAEKAADGKEIRTFTGRLGAVCYRDDTGELRSIDTTIRDLGTHVGVEWAPYKFRLHETGIGFDFESREGGQCSVTLTGIGGEKFKDSIKPEVADNTITYRDVRPGCDIVFKCLNERVKTLRILRDDKAPRTFEWTVTSDKPELIDSTLTGTDAAGNELELSSSVLLINESASLISETWSGKAGDGEPVYPVEIDPSVTVNPTASADDGYEASGGFTSNIFILIGDGYNPGFRFPSVTVPNAATISEATLGLYQIAYFSSPGGGGTIYGRAVDNAGQFGTGANLPSAVSKTTATATYPPTTTDGQKTITVTTIVQEIVNRAGWASGNAIGFPIIGNQATYSYISAYDNGSNIPYLSITYTAAAGGTAANLLLLGCG